MTTQPPQDAPVYSLAHRKTAMIGFGVPLVAGIALVLLQYKGLINVEHFGLHENYAYVGGLAAAFVGLISIFVVWRCPCCWAYLGKEGNPSQCPGCGAKFR